MSPEHHPHSPSPPSGAGGYFSFSAEINHPTTHMIDQLLQLALLLALGAAAFGLSVAVTLFAWMGADWIKRRWQRR